MPVTVHVKGAVEAPRQDRQTKNDGFFCARVRLLPILWNLPWQVEQTIMM